MTIIPLHTLLGNVPTNLVVDNARSPERSGTMQKRIRKSRSVSWCGVDPCRWTSTPHQPESDENTLRRSDLLRRSMSDQKLVTSSTGLRRPCRQPSPPRRREGSSTPLRCPVRRSSRDSMPTIQPENKIDTCSVKETHKHVTIDRYIHPKPDGNGGLARAVKLTTSTPRLSTVIIGKGMHNAIGPNGKTITTSQFLTEALAESDVSTI